MPATVRYDDQYCPIARALDVLGDRWTLLVLRELLAGEQRFTDLRRHLPGIAPGVLSARLSTLQEQGLIVASDADTARPKYSITPRGREAQSVMRALARFGMPLMEDPAEVDVVRPWSAVQTCLLAYWDRAAAEGTDDLYLFRVDGREFPVSTAPGTSPDGRTPVLEVETSAATLFAIRKGLVGLDDAITAGDLTVHGPKAAVRRMRNIYRLDAVG